MRVGVRGERKTRDIHYKHLCIYDFIFSNTHHHNTICSNEYSFEKESGRVNKNEKERREREEEIKKGKRLYGKECGRR